MTLLRTLPQKIETKLISKSSKNLAENSFSFKCCFSSNGTFLQQPKRKKNVHFSQQNQHSAIFKTEEERPNCFFILLVFNFMHFPSKWFFWSKARWSLMFKESYTTQFHSLKTLIQQFFKDTQCLIQKTANEAKTITSKSDSLLHSNTPVNNFHFWVHKLLTSLKTWERAPGKEYLRVTCPKGKLEFKYSLSPEWG